ncbi:hypothetical protein NSMS1_08080 [Nostoc sp. MS1]|nr:hypothetical protein NSMS1_08080 [Nostoc sp. MS1]
MLTAVKLSILPMQHKKGVGSREWGVGGDEGDEGEKNITTFCLLTMDYGLLTNDQ